MRRYGIRRSPGWVEAFSYRPATHPPALRGTVRSWSRRSRARLIKSLASVRWPTGRHWIGVTLTYPADFPGCAESKAHLRAFRERWGRRWESPVGVWKMEFQRRGAPHYHVMLPVPTAIPVEKAEVLVKRWAARAWCEITCETRCVAHRRHGVKVVRLFSNAWQYLVGEFAGAKGYQEVAPDGIEWVGRWWGLWSLQKDVVEDEISEAEFYRLRRQLRRLAHKRRYFRRFRSASEGIWLLSRAPAGALAEQLHGWLEAGMLETVRLVV